MPARGGSRAGWKGTDNVRYPGLENKRALVTGASGAVGGAVAEELARGGVRVAVHYRSNEAAARAVVERITAAGGEAVQVSGDVSDSTEARRLAAEATDRLGGLEILVNNAGITRDALLARMSDDDWDAVIDTNLKSAFLCSRAVVRSMMRARSGRIINVSSVAGLMGNAGQANYSAAKAGLIGFTKSLAREVASRNVTVNAVAPGFLESPMTDAIPEVTRNELVKMIPMRRMGAPADVAGVVAFLACDLAAYVTGQVVVVDGGLAM